MVSMQRFVFASAYFVFASFAFISENVWDKIERFGLPTVLLLALFGMAYKQNEKRMHEQREFWADNNNYLRQLLKEMRDNSACRYKQ